MVPTLEEELMLGLIREWSETDRVRLTIEVRDGAWELSVSVAPFDINNTSRGTGATFKDAWNNMNPTWA